MRPILITGSHRSGTTWVGNIISTAPKVLNIHEPFNIGERISNISTPFPFWYQYIDKSNEESFRSIIEPVIQLKYPFSANIRRCSTPRELFRTFRGFYKFTKARLNKTRPIFKDPIALFSSEWLYRNYNFKILITVRHPAAFASSLKLKNWEFDFTNLAHQKNLIDAHLKPFENEILNACTSPPSLIEQACLIWNAIHSTIAKWQKIHDDWIIVRHEDLSTDPENAFKGLFNKLDLPLGKQTLQLIHKSSGSNNPVEQTRGMEFLRNSKANIKNWQSRLSDDEIDTIWEKTQKYAAPFYSDKDWL